MHTAIIDLIAAAKSLHPSGLIGDGKVARFHELARRAEEALDAIPADPHTSHLILNHRVELDYRGTITVDGFTYAAGVLAGGLITPPGQWVQITRGQDGGLRTITAREETIARPYVAAAQAGKVWQDIKSAPDLERVIVAGWEHRCGGYWWYHEDVVSNGRAIEHPRATLWRPFDNPPFPAFEVCIQEGTSHER